MSKILIEKRGEKLMTRKDLAAAVGVTVSCVQGWETGIRKPRALYLRKLKKVLDISNEDLLTLVGLENVK